MGRNRYAAVAFFARPLNRTIVTDQATTKNQEAEEQKPQETTQQPQDKNNEPASRFTTEAVKPGSTVRISQKIIEGNKERIQVFEGMVLARRGKRGVDETITVRKLSQGFGVERIYPLALPTITNIEVVKQSRVRRAKLHYLRNPRARKLRDKA